MAEERWQMMKENMLESAKEHMPVTKRKWMTSEILDLMEERRKAKSDEQKYRELDNQVEKKCNEAKEGSIPLANVSYPKHTTCEGTRF